MYDPTLTPLHIYIGGSGISESRYFCVSCNGFYGVPHTDCHDRYGDHVCDLHMANQCACRPCRERIGQVEPGQMDTQREAPGQLLVQQLALAGVELHKQLIRPTAFQENTKKPKAVKLTPEQTGKLTACAKAIESTLRKAQLLARLR